VRYIPKFGKISVKFSVFGSCTVIDVPGIDGGEIWQISSHR